MKKILLFLTFLLLCANAYADVPFGVWSKNESALLMASVVTTSTQSVFLIDAACVAGTSGKCFEFSFVSPITQTGALTIYTYCTTETGTASSSSIDIYNSADAAEDPDRPDTAEGTIASSGNVSCVGCGPDKWLTYSVTAVTLSAGVTYWGVLHNDTATQASNNFSIVTRGTFTGAGGSNGNIIRTYTTTDGGSTDPTVVNGPPSIVLKFADGTLKGLPYISTIAAGSGTEDRGSRWKLSEDWTSSGAIWNSLVTGQTTTKMYAGASEVASTVTLDDTIRIRRFGAVWTSQYTATGGTAYDIVLKTSTSTATGPTVYDMGNSPPTDVLNSGFSNLTYVHGATPGSYTESTQSFMAIAPIIDEMPAISGQNTLYDTTLYDTTLN